MPRLSPLPYPPITALIALLVLAGPAAHTSLSESALQITSQDQHQSQTQPSLVPPQFIGLPKPFNTTPGNLPPADGPTLSPISETTKDLLSDRVVKRFDFNETDNLDPVPRNWIRLTGPQYPDWNNSAFEPPTAASSDTNRWVRVPTQGGDAGIRLISGVVPVLPETDYRIGIRVRTVNSRWSRARVIAYFVTDQSQPIPGLRATSSPLETDGQWQDVEIQLSSAVAANEQDVPPGRSEGAVPTPPGSGAPSASDAAWMIIELHVEQPSTWDPGPHIEQSVNFEDVAGACAEFDDLVIWRVPRIEMFASETNVIDDPAGVDLKLRVQDVSPGQLNANLQVLNANGDAIDTEDLRIHGDRRIQHWQPRLTQYGWYRVVADITEAGRTVGRSMTDFAWIPPIGGTPNEPVIFHGFGLNAQFESHRYWPTLYDLMHIMGTEDISLPLWSSDLKSTDLKQNRSDIAPILHALTTDGRVVTLIIPTLPDEIAARAGIPADRVLQAFGQKQEDAWRYIGESLLGFGQNVSHWQFGPTGDIYAYRAPEAPAELSTIERRIRELVPTPVLVIPWSIINQWPTSQWPFSSSVPGPPPAVAMASANLPTANLPLDARNDSVSPSGNINPSDRLLSPEISTSTPHAYRANLLIPNEIMASQVGEYLRQFDRLSGLSTSNAGSAATAPNCTILIEPANLDQFGTQHLITDLLQRTILLWETGARRLDIPAPWTLGDKRSGRIIPTVALPVWRTLAQELSGRTAVARLDLGPGLVAIVFRGDRDSDGMIALWNDSPDRDQVDLASFLGTGSAYAVDASGNRRELALSEGKHHLTVTREPQFIEGADINLALFRSGFSIEPKFIDGAAAVHQHVFKLTNPWRSNIVGTMRIIEPANWNIRQRVRTLNLPAGQTISIPVTFTYPAYELAGTKRFVVDIDVQSDRPTTVRLEAPVELGFHKISLDPRYQFITTPEGRKQLIITEEIINNYDQPIGVTAYAIVNGFGRQEVDIPVLQPGESSIRIFRFDTGDRSSAISQARVGLRERSGPGRLNLLLPIEP